MTRQQEEIDRITSTENLVEIRRLVYDLASERDRLKEDKALLGHRLALVSDTVLYLVTFLVTIVAKTAWEIKKTDDDIHEKLAYIRRRAIRTAISATIEVSTETRTSVESAMMENLGQMPKEMTADVVEKLFRTHQLMQNGRAVSDFANWLIIEFMMDKPQDTNPSPPTT